MVPRSMKLDQGERRSNRNTVSRAQCSTGKYYVADAARESRALGEELAHGAELFIPAVDQLLWWKRREFL
jgi:hypothetical protein